MVLAQFPTTVPSPPCLVDKNAPQPSFRVVTTDETTGGGGFAAEILPPLPNPKANRPWNFAQKSRPARSMLWVEWFEHQRLLLVFAFVWLASVWMLPLILHPLWTLSMGILVAVVAGPAFGGADVIHGCEEFVFAGATTRGHRYLARLVVGGGTVLLFSALSVASLEGNLSDVLLRLVLATGSAPAQVSRPEMLYALVFAVPLATFSLGFALAALAHSRLVVLTSWLWAALGALALLRGGLQLEELKWDTLNGRFALPLLVLVSAMTLWVGGRFYRRKEAGSGNVPLRVPPSFWGWVAGLIIAALGLVVLVSWFVGNFGRLL